MLDSMRLHGTEREKLWVVITMDGRHVWLGRNTDPTSEELRRTAEQLDRQSLTGFLGITEGSYYNPSHTLSVMFVRLLAGEGDWETAKAAFLSRRADAIRNG